MNRDQRMLLIAILIFAAFGAYHLAPGWISQLAGRKSVATGARSQAVPEAPTAKKSSEVAEAKVRREPVDESAPWGRNPFLTEAEATRGKALGLGETDGLRVKAIIAGHPKSVALINGRAITVGEKIGDEKVVAIRKDSVVLEVDGMKRSLRISEPWIKIEVKEGKR